MAWAVTSASSSAPWGAPLVVDDGEAFALLRQAQHGLAKLPPRGVDPAGAQDEVLGAGLLDELFAFELGAAVHAQGRGVSVSTQGGAAAVEHVVGAVVHQPGPRAAASRASTPGVVALSRRASSGSLSALSTAVWRRR